MKVWVRGLREARTPEEKQTCFEDAMRTFKRVCNREGKLQELRKREFYEKPGVKRRHKHEAALKAKNKKKKRF